MLFRLTFAAYLVEALCDIALCVFFYILLEPVDKRLALLSAFFGIASMVMYAVGQSSFFASYLVLGDSPGMTSFSTTSGTRSRISRSGSPARSAGSSSASTASRP
jgi:hypothetical protein